MIFQPLRGWLISGVPLGQVRTKFHEGEVRKIILGWTICKAIQDCKLERLSRISERKL